MKVKAQQAVTEAKDDTDTTPYDDGFILWLFGTFSYLL